MQFSIYTLGCKVNQYESQSMHQNLCSAGYIPVSTKSQPDIFIINSCTVTAQSDHKVRQVLHRVRRENPSSVIILTGCMPQAFPAECESLEDADIILGNTCRAELIPSIEAFLANGERIISISQHLPKSKFENMKINNFEDRTRAFVKIEDGCNRFCSYCIIPYARGRVRSKPIEGLTQETRELASAGYKEIVLVGINLSAYGQDIGSDLYTAIRAVSLIAGIERIRLGSLEPDLLTVDIIQKLSQIQKFCPQFHLSLQSGCDKTLERMHRRYTTEDYRNIVNSLRNTFENPGITTDIMVGFAGETEEEFQQSLAFAMEICFSKVHVFAYSRRKGTKAYSLPDQVTNAEKERRSRMMIQATHESAVKNASSQAEAICHVLFEREIEPQVYEGYSENYTLVHTKAKVNLCGEIRRVKIKENVDTTCIGELL